MNQLHEEKIKQLEEINKQLEEDLKQRHRQIVQLTEQIQQLQNTPQTQGNVVELKSIIAELEEKLKQMRNQNEKLLEKNQSDVIEWKTKEKLFNDKISNLQINISSLEKNLSEVEAKLQARHDTSEQDKKSLNSNIKNEINNKLADIENLQIQLKSYQQMLAQESNINSSLKNELLKVEGELSEVNKINSDSNQANIQLLQFRDNLQNKMKEQSSAHDLMKIQFDHQQIELEKSQKEYLSNTDQLFQFRQQLHERNQLLEDEKISSNGIQQRLLISERDLKDKSLRLKQNQEEYKNEMLKLLQINEKSSEKFKEQFNQQSTNQQQSDSELNLLRKEQLESKEQADQEDNLKQIKILQLQKTNKEYKKTILDYEYKMKDIVKQLDDKSKQYIKQLEQQKMTDGELKQILVKFRQVQEQMVIKDEDLQRSKLIKNKLMIDNQDFKNKQEIQQNQINKLKSTVVQDLKKLLEEKEQEIILIKEVVKSTKIMLRVKDSDLGRLKQRCKQLELDNLDLLNKYQSLEGIFQDIMQTSKNKQSVSPQLKNSKVLSNSSSVGVKPKYYNQLALLGRKDILSEQHYNGSEYQGSDNFQTYTRNDELSDKQNSEKSFNKPVQVMRSNRVNSQVPIKNLNSIQENQNDLNDSMKRADYTFKESNMNDPIISKTNEKIGIIDQSLLSSQEHKSSPSFIQKFEGQSQQQQLQDDDVDEDNNKKPKQINQMSNEVDQELLEDNDDQFIQDQESLNDIHLESKDMSPQQSNMLRQSVQEIKEQRQSISLSVSKEDKDLKEEQVESGHDII